MALAIRRVLTRAGQPALGRGPPLAGDSRHGSGLINGIRETRQIGSGSADSQNGVSGGNGRRCTGDREIVALCRLRSQAGGLNGRPSRIGILGIGPVVLVVLLHLGLHGGQQVGGICNAATHDVVVIRGQRDARQNPDDSQRDQQFDQREACRQVSDLPFGKRVTARFVPSTQHSDLKKIQNKTCGSSGSHNSVPVCP